MKLILPTILTISTSILIYNEKSIYLKYNGKMEGVLSQGRKNISAKCIFMVYSRETEAS